MGEILLRRDGGDWREPDVRSVRDEAELQDLLVASPQLIPGIGDDPALAVKEFAVSSGYIDIVAVSADGSVTIVECKLGANPEIRRHVIGQVFAYAASLWRMPYDDFETAFEARWGKPLRTAGEIFEGDWSYPDFRRAVADTLSVGAFRIVIAVDEITEELKRTVLYLNSTTAPGVEVLALEVGLVRDGDLQILIPVVYGEESATAKRSQAGRRWMRDEFIEHAAEICAPDNHRVIQLLLAWADAHDSESFWGEGKRHPSLTAWVDVDGVPCPVWTCYLADEDKTVVSPNFEWLSTRLNRESLARLAADLRAIPALARLLSDLEEKDYRRRPSLPISVLADDTTLQRFLAAFDQLIETGRSLGDG